MTLFIDKLEKNNLGGFTTDKRKIEYILYFAKLSIEKIFGDSKKGATPFGLFVLGDYIITYGISIDKEIVVGVLHHTINIDQNINTFLDCFPPKAVQGFHTLQTAIKNKPSKTFFEISDNDLDFEIAFASQNKHRFRQIE